MKKLFSLTLLLLCGIVAMAQQPQLPTFSTAGNEVWYYVQFKNGKGVIADKGNDANLRTEAPQKKLANQQLWKLVGNQNNFELVNKQGRHVYFKGNRFACATGKTGELKLIASPQTNYAPAWEIGAKALEGNKAMNQHGGAGIGKEIGAWQSDGGNPLHFVAESEMEFADALPEPVAEYAKIIPNFSYYKDPQGEVLKHPNTLWYTTPATDWQEYALPIGDGQFGAMLFAGIRRDLIQFNEKTLWSGNTKNYGYYLNFGHLYIDNLQAEDGSYYSKYARYLNLETATAGYDYTNAKTQFHRQYIASSPARAIIVRLSKDGTKKLSHKFFLYNPNGKGATYAVENGKGKGEFAGDLDLVSYNAQIRVVPTGGTMTADATGITVKDADEILVFLAGDTNYDLNSPTFIHDKGQIKPTVDKRLEDATAKTWDKLYAEHVKDYQSLYNRVKLELTGAKNEKDTKALLTAYNSNQQTGREAHVLMLEQIYFNYGRYLMIASSRTSTNTVKHVDLPSNLQGIWNNSLTPPWHADLHANINVQMNYWPAESMNLSDLHMPFLNYICKLASGTQWKENAKKSGQKEGWVCYTENNIYGWHGGFALNYVIANAWYCTHLWQHYRYTLDEKFLKEKALPTMVSATKYWMERLIKDRKVNDGTWVAPNEFSPEHGPNEDGVAHAQQLIWDLFHNTLQAIEVLGVENAGVSADFVAQLKDKFTHLDTGLHTEEYQGKTYLREWKYSPITSGQTHHRHMSHLMALHPLNQVSPSSEYFQPMINSLIHRTDASTGWSMGWKINLWARALDGDHARNILKLALRHSQGGSGGVYYNLFDSHPPFQIDGNFGATAGIGEMLLQSQHDTLQILPALPSTWQDGSIKGMKAVKDFTVSITWQKGKAAYIEIKSGKGQRCVISYPTIKDFIVKEANGKEVKNAVRGEGTLAFDTEKDGVYRLYANTEILNSIKQAKKNNKPVIKGRTVTVNGNPHTQVFDLGGQLVLDTHRSFFVIPAEAGSSFIIKSTYLDEVKTTKVVL